MSNLFTNPADLTAAVLVVVNPGPIVVPTIKEQLTELIQPGRAVAFRTESGSLYEINMYSTLKVVLVKVDEETGGINEIAKGELIGVRDSERGVVGIVVKEPSGRLYKPSAVVKVWLAYDANTNTHHHEP